MERTDLETIQLSVSMKRSRLISSGKTVTGVEQSSCLILSAADVIGELNVTPDSGNGNSERHFLAVIHPGGSE